jgi:hypothetical protein
VTFASRKTSEPTDDAIALTAASRSPAVRDLVDELTFLGTNCRERAPSCAPRLAKRAGDDLVTLTNDDISALAEQASACLKLCRAKP